MNNKPKYNFFKNTQYALEGLAHLLRVETSFKIELVVGLLVFALLFYLPFELWQITTLVCAYFLLLIVEVLNSAIENVVDLVTTNHAPLAKAAKDVASTAVMLSILLNTFLWGLFLLC